MASAARTVALAAMTLGLTLGGSSTAMAAAEFHGSSGSASKDGATLTVVHSRVGDDGKVSYEHVTYSASRDGATVESTTATAE
jgi:hypothetical protein